MCVMVQLLKIHLIANNTLERDSVSTLAVKNALREEQGTVLDMGEVDVVLSQDVTKVREITDSVPLMEAESVAR